MQMYMVGDRIVIMLLYITKRTLIPYPFSVWKSPITRNDGVA
jgi:hypothetical protein